MAIENFTTYEKLDDGNDLTIIASKITVATVQYGQDNSVVSKDFGVDHFDEWEWLFSIEHTQATDKSGFMVAAVSNSVDEWHTIYAAHDDAVGLLVLKTSGGNFGLYLRDMNNWNTDSYVHLEDTQYWCTFKRVGTTATVEIYSDADRTDKLATLEIETEDVNYRYVLPYAATNFSTETKTASGYIENLDLQEVPCTVSTGEATDIAQTTATLEGTLDTMGNETSVDATFEYGETDAYGEETTGSTETETGDISEGIESLTANTTYHFRIKAVGTYGTAYGDDAEFDTLAKVVAIRVKGVPFGLKPARVVKVGRIGV